MKASKNSKKVSRTSHLSAKKLHVIYSAAAKKAWKTIRAKARARKIAASKRTLKRAA